MARTPRPRRVDPATKNGNQGDGGGREPIVFSEKQVERVQSLAGYGLPEFRIAWIMGVSPETLIEIKARQPEVDRALKDGLNIAAGQIGQSLFQKAIGFKLLREKVKPDGTIERETIYKREPDLGSIVWWEKTRLGYSDVKQVRHADAQGNPLPPAQPAQVRVYAMPDNGRGIQPVDAEELRGPVRENGDGKANGRR
jgi:hypothetical protein